VIFGVKSWQ